MGQLDDAVAVITGGESGIGLACARLFTREGARVHLVGIQEGKLEEAVDQLGSDRASASVADVTDEQAVHDAVEAGFERFGRLDVLLSNAGISGAVAPIVDYPGDVFARTLAVHVTGAFHVLKHGLPRLTDGGSVIITSSVVGLMGFAQASAYVAAKHGQVGLMRAAAKEVAARRIRVNTLHPGPTSTPFQDAIEMAATGLPQAQAAEVFDGMIPLGRHTTVEEIAQAALYLASDASAMVTASTFTIDGGLSG
ncbi:NAD(P)-dependent dehydrogenase (short-subunit alcohol dehydrogenase family) [Geodermatophilus tzadiensis]|uniref:NAD(P)-dependent dehydrogenase (Short-subunit alcohol dehydrogenase family) n=1 Tax=Geodermatophilus tzadiensis TaxID=1137988 RepID=A0A2T0TTC1_9ACTN|nr:SDR family oxidoreductase [Geodermatophilus tzadiensis]PRY48956.1 NAD(P)-dependent dehydrogenase (short-subunit alcohol dehydrogenase family) [Geodermatophilus tzadiensis]